MDHPVKGILLSPFQFEREPQHAVFWVLPFFLAQVAVPYLPLVLFLSTSTGPI
jgi:hypothetical protein